MLAYQDVLLRLLLAIALGGAVGLERERMAWAAGLRTHMLVCLGSALIMIVSAFGFSDVLGTPGVVLDPSRVAAQVVSGIGFLGAGTILFLRHEVIRGLTTAASLWTVAAIGLAVGGGLYLAAIASTVVVVAILALLKPLERRIFPRNGAHEVTVTADSDQLSVRDIVSTLEAAGVRVLEIHVRRHDGAGTDQLRLTLAHEVKPEAALAALDRLKSLAGIREVTSRR